MCYVQIISIFRLQEKNKSSPTGQSPNMKEICQNQEIDTPEKAMLLKSRANSLFKTVSDVCEQNRETLVSVLGHMCALKDQQAQEIVKDVVDMVVEKRGLKTFKELISEEALQSYVKAMRVPDWVLVYFKIKARISDSTWQTAINCTNLGRTGVSFNFIKATCYKFFIHSIC